MNIKSNSKRKWGIFGGLSALVIVAASVLWLGLPARAATGTATIAINTLSGADADNSGAVGTDSQWTYEAINKKLTLNTYNGNYTLTGTNSDLWVFTSTGGINVTLSNVTLASPTDTTFYCPSNGTVTLPSGSVNNISASGASTHGFSAGNCTITGSGTLNISATGTGFTPAIDIVTNSTLTITGGAQVIAQSDWSGIWANNNSTLTVSSGGNIQTTGAGYGIYNGGGAGSYTLDINTSATITLTSSSKEAVAVGGTGTIYITGTGWVRATPAAGFNAVLTSNPIYMSDTAHLTMDNKNSSPEVHSFTKSSAATTHRWNLLNLASTSDPLTNDTIAVSVAGNQQGSVMRELIPVTTLYSASATVTAPVGGEVRSMTATPGNSSQYTASVYQWLEMPGAIIMGSTDPFVTGRTYQVLVTLTPQSGYAFNDPLSVTINGLTATKDVGFGMPANTYWVEIVATAGDTTPPVVTGTYHYRYATTSAAISYSTDEPGTLYYKVLDSGDPAPTKTDVKATGINLGAITSSIGWNPTVTAAAHDIYAVVEDAANNISNPALVSVPAYTPPVLSAGSVNRTSDTTSTVDFTTSEAGTMQYLVQNSGAPTPSNPVSSFFSLGAVPSGSVTGKSIPLTAGAKDIYIVVWDAENNISDMLLIPAAAYVPAPNALTGTATISNTSPKIGDSLTASLGSTNNTGTLSYQWKVGGSNVGTNSASYTVVVGDLGKTITVTISSSVETGTITSVATSAVVKKTAAQPPVPTLDTKTCNTITLVDTAGHEYSKDNGSTWQSSPIFTGLSANTEYNLVQRALETADTYLSIASAQLPVTTDPYALTGTATIDNTTPKVGDILTATASTNNTGTLSYQWEVGGVSAGTGATYTVVAGDFGKTITVTVTSSVETGTITSTATAAVASYTYTIVSGDNGIWMRNSAGDYIFIIDGPYANFLGVKVDGTMLAAGVDYIAAKGSTIVTLKAAYLTTLALGGHDINFLFAQADNVSGRFRVLAATAGITSPRTSDMNIAMVIATSVISIIGIVGSTIAFKKHA